ncbi:MAG: SDR family NAD(P)-dependent oxidoreductase [Pacificimonas sp.]
MGYVAGHLATSLRAAGWTVLGTGRRAREDVLAFDDPTVRTEIDRATHLLSSVPPADGSDPVLSKYGDALQRFGGWKGYLSSTGVYGDCDGAWVDETAPIGTGRRTARSQADADWQAFGSFVFRLPGIYGPGRSPFARLRSGDVQRIDAPGQVFSRAHVDDIVSGIRLAMTREEPRTYNICDDLPASAADVTAYAAGAAGLPLPPLIPLAEAELSPMARGFYSENRRVANGRAKRELGWRPRYLDYRFGLRAIWEEEQAT